MTAVIGGVADEKIYTTARAEAVHFLNCMPLHSVPDDSKNAKN